MKKITLLSLLLLSSISFAQVTLSQNTSNSVVAGSITCNAGGIPRENTFYRYFNLTSLGYSQFEVTRIDFAVETFTAGTSPYFVDVQVYENTGGTFPAGTLNLLGSQTVEILSTYVGTVVPITLTTPITVTSPQMVIGLKIHDAVSLSGASFFPGSNGLGQSAPTYIVTTACGITTPTDMANIGFPNVHLILTATGNPTLGVEDFEKSTIIVFPNPVKDILSIQLTDNEILQSVEILNISGSRVTISNENTINVSQLQSGIYFVNVKTSDNNFLQKFIKD